jgi:hypothetical protein
MCVIVPWVRVTMRSESIGSSLERPKSATLASNSGQGAAGVGWGPASRMLLPLRSPWSTLCSGFGDLLGGAGAGEAARRRRVAMPGLAPCAPGHWPPAANKAPPCRNPKGWLTAAAGSNAAPKPRSPARPYEALPGPPGPCQALINGAKRGARLAVQVPHGRRNLHRRLHDARDVGRRAAANRAERAARDGVGQRAPRAELQHLGGFGQLCSVWMVSGGFGRGSSALSAVLGRRFGAFRQQSRARRGRSTARSRAGDPQTQRTAQSWRPPLTIQTSCRGRPSSQTSTSCSG